MYPLKNFFKFIWLLQVLAVACRFFFFFFFAVATCGMQLSEQGLSPCPPALGARVLETGPPGKSLSLFLKLGLFSSFHG